MSRPVQRHRTQHTSRPRANPELLAELAYRLTQRDREVIELVWEHRVLTTHQLTAICFANYTKARHRLLILYRLTALERFQPWAPSGGTPWHWVLGPGGAHVLAGRRGLDPAELGYRKEMALAISHSIKLGHQVGVNDFFAQLHAAARTIPGAAVSEWWPERRCAALWGDLARPDAYGRWTEAGAEFDFFLEHDTGSETLAQVTGKLAGYAALAESTGISTPVLLWLPSAAREANLRKEIGTPEVPVATAVHTPATTQDGPAGPVWLPVGQPSTRVRLADLAHAWPEATRQDRSTAGEAS